MERSMSNRRDVGRVTPRNLERSRPSSRMTPAGSLKKSSSALSNSSLGEQSPSEPADKEDKFQVGKQVMVQDKKGIIRFVGETQFSTGKWLGIELFDASGKNDGSVQGIRYFNAHPDHGLFVRPSQAKLLETATLSTEKPENSLTIPLARNPSSSTHKASKSTRLETRRQTIATGRNFYSQSSESTTPISAKIPSTSSSRSATPIASLKPKLPPEITPAQHMAQNSDLLAPKNVRALGKVTPEIINKTSTQGLAQSVSTQELQHDTTLSSVGSEQISSATNPNILDEIWRPVLSMDQSVIFDNTPKLVKHDQTVPLAKYDELKSKVKFLEQKRAEERSLIHEAEEMKSKFNQAMRAQEKLVEKLKSLKQEYQETSAQYAKSQEKINDLETTLYEERETLELVAVEKEMAEEQIEGYKQDSVILKEQLEELQDRIKLYEGTEAQNSEFSTSVELAQLRSKNIRLVEALRLLRDEREDEASRFKDQIKEMEKDVYQGKKATDQLEKQALQISQQLAVIEELKQRLEDTGDAEDLISELSDRNSRLSDRVGDLESQVEHWQSMYEVSEEMYEGTTEEIKTLNTEINRLEWEVQERDQRILSMKSTIEENASMIARFREAVSQLKQDREKAEEKQQEMRLHVEETEEATKNLEKLAYNAGRAIQGVTFREIALELQKLESSQLLLQLDITKTYLPTNATKDINDSIASLLGLQRIMFKADLVCKHFEESTKSSGTVTKELFSAAQARRMLMSIARTVEILVTNLFTCDEHEFARSGFILQDINLADTCISELVEQVRKSETSLPSAIEISKKLLLILAAVEKKLALSAKSNSSLVQPRVKLYVFEIGCRIDEVQCVLFLLAQKFESIGSSAKNIIDVSRDAKVEAVKLQFKIEEYRQKELVVKEDQVPIFYDILLKMKKISAFFEAILDKLPGVFVIGTNDTGEDDGSSDIGDVLMSASAETLTKNNGSPISLVQELFADLLSSVKLAYELSNDSSNFETLAARITPWDARSKKNNDKLQKEENTKEQLDGAQREVLAMAKKIKQKDHQVEEMKMQIMVLDKRSSKVKELELNNNNIQSQLSKKQLVNEELEKMVESLHAEIDALKSKSSIQKVATSELQSQNIQVKANDKSDTSSSPTGAARDKSGPTLLSELDKLSGTIGRIEASDWSLLGELRACRNSLRLAKLESIKLKSVSAFLGSDFAKEIYTTSLQTPRIKSKFGDDDFVSNGPELPAAKKTRKAEIQKGVAEAKIFVDDALLLAAAPKLVRLNPGFQRKPKDSSSIRDAYTDSGSSYWEILGLERAIAIKATELSTKLF